MFVSTAAIQIKELKWNSFVPVTNAALNYV